MGGGGGMRGGGGFGGGGSRGGGGGFGGGNRGGFGGGFNVNRGGIINKPFDRFPAGRFPSGFTNNRFPGGFNSFLFNKNLIGTGLGFGFGGFGGFGFGGLGLGWGLGWPGFGGGYGFGYDPFAFGAGFGGYGPGPGAAPVTVVYPPQPPAQVIYVEPPRPVIHEYDWSAPASSPIYLVALKDGRIFAATSYQVEAGSFQFVTVDGEKKQTPVDTIDRPLTLRLNRERKITIVLPE